MKRNITLVYALRFTWSFLLVQAVMVPFFHRRGLSDTRIFLVQSIFALVLLLGDVPAGFLSDRVGRRTALIAAGIFKGLGGTTLVFADGFGGMALSYVLIGIANSLLSGTDVALLYETHRALDGDKPPTATLQSRAHLMTTVSTIAAAILGGVLAYRSLDAVVAVNAAFAWLSLVVAFFIVEPTRSAARRSAHFARVSDAARKLFVEDRPRRWLSLATIVLGAAPMLALFVFQKRWTDLAFPLSWFGGLAALQSVTSTAFGLWIGRRLDGRLPLLFVAVLPVISFFGAGAGVAAIAVGASLLLEVLRMLVQVVLLDRINVGLTSDRATANSILSFGGRLVVVAVGPILGFMVEAHGTRAAFGLLFAVYGCFALVLFFGGRTHARVAAGPQAETNVSNRPALVAKSPARPYGTTVASR